MKKTFYLWLLAAVLVVGCSNQPKSEKFAPDANILPPKDPPRVEVTIAKDNFKNAFEAFKGKKVTILFIYNLPDSYLIKAKSKINPPDSALQEVMNLQSDRVEWLNETLVAICGSCNNFQVEVPLKLLPENLLLYFIDKASLQIELSWADIAKLQNYVKNDYLWIILGTEDSEQKRGESDNKSMVAAVGENRVTLRSFVFDMKKKQMLNHIQVLGMDEEVVLYGKQEGEGAAPILFERMKSKATYLPMGVSFDSIKFDEVYPYPPIPESGLIIRKSLAALMEVMSPQ